MSDSPAAPEAASAAPVDPLQRSRTIVAWLVVVATLGLFSPLTASMPWRGDCASYVLAITFEAVPWILLGALISGLIESLVPRAWLPRIAARLGPAGVPVTAIVAPAFPTCECGVVPIVRSLLRKGLPPAHALTYLLAAPVLNPVVLFTTWLAFQDGRMVALRAGGAVLIAIIGGLLLTRSGTVFANMAAVHGHSHDHHHGTSLLQRAGHLAEHVFEDFVEMMVFFLFGVLIAAALRTFLGANVLSVLGDSEVTGTLTMMGTAFVMSLCSEADAFLAVTFTEFSRGALLAFLVFGPMCDLKLLVMFRAIMPPRAILILVVYLVFSCAFYALAAGSLFL